MNGKIHLACGLCLVVCSFAATAFPWEYDLRDSDDTEGQECKMEDGSDGVCSKITECSIRLEEVRNGTRTDKGRCGFDGDIEIVCCPTSTVKDKLSDTLRPADRACTDYKNEVVPKEVGFHILRGVAAKDDEIPHIAALGYAKPTEEDPGRIVYNCGGTLISYQHILTAAHCVANLEGSVPVVVMLGSVDLNGTGEKIQRVNISRIIPHPKYRFSQNYNDIAILKLSTAVKLSSAVQPACLQTRSTTNASLRVAGWGSTDFAEDGSPILLKASGLEIVERSICSRSYSNWQERMPHGLDDSLVCVIDSDKGRRADTCQGDSGGPLFFTSGNDSIIMGVTAFGQTCGSPVPSIYTSVYSYLDWIEREVWQ